MWKRPRNSGSRFQPRIGREFEIENVQIIEARSRGFVGRAVTIGTGVAVATTGAYGLTTGNYIAAEVVWAVAGPMVGVVLTHYFGSAGKDLQ